MYFAPTDPVEPWPERLGPGAVLLHGFARPEAPALIADSAAQAGFAGFLPDDPVEAKLQFDDI